MINQRRERGKGGRGTSFIGIFFILIYRFLCTIECFSRVGVVGA